MAGVRQQRRDAPQGVNEAQVQHLVGFIQNQVLGLVQDHGFAVQQVDQASRGGHQQVGAPRQAVDLGCDGHAPHHHAHFDVGPLGIGGQIVFDLFCQFPRRGQDQAAHGFGRGLFAHFQQVVDHRQAEGGRFAGAGLGQAHDVDAVHGQRDGLLLNGGGGRQTLFGQLAHQTGHQPQGIEIHEG